MADAPIIAAVTETGKGVFQSEVQVSGHSIIADEPETMGGDNSGPTPMELLASALAACTAMTVRWYARKQNWPLEHVSVELSHQKGGEGAISPRQDVFTKVITLKGAQLTAEQQGKLLEVAAKCPVQRVLEGTPLIHTSQV